MAGKHKYKEAPEDRFYKELGNRLRLARAAAGKSQADVAEHLECSFQQLQKYEKGTNRIPIRELDRLAAYLDVPLTHLVDSSGGDAAFNSLTDKLSAKGFHTLLESWAAIKDQPMRAAILQMVKCAAALSRSGR